MRCTLSSPERLPLLVGLPTEASDFRVVTLALLGESAGSSVPFLNFACEGVPALFP